MASRPMVSTSSTLWSPTTFRMAASDMSRNACLGSRRWNSHSFGSLIRYWTIHSTTATFRSPVSIEDSWACSGLVRNCDRTSADTVSNPNSSLSWRCTGTLVTVSTPKGILRWGPGSVVRTYFPKRCTTPTASGSIW